MRPVRPFQLLDLGSQRLDSLGGDRLAVRLVCTHHLSLPRFPRRESRTEGGGRPRVASPGPRSSAGRADPRPWRRSRPEWGRPRGAGGGRRRRSHRSSNRRLRPGSLQSTSPAWRAASTVSRSVARASNFGRQPAPCAPSSCPSRSGRGTTGATPPSGANGSRYELGGRVDGDLRDGQRASRAPTPCRHRDIPSAGQVVHARLAAAEHAGAHGRRHVVGVHELKWDARVGEDRRRASGAAAAPAGAAPASRRPPAVGDVLISAASPARRRCRAERRTPRSCPETLRAASLELRLLGRVVEASVPGARHPR